MLAGIRRTLMSPVVGLIATAVALTLAVTLGLVAGGWGNERAVYEARIAALRDASARVEMSLRTELATCQTSVQVRAVPPSDDVTRPMTAAGARRLLERGPEGIDACARMESADRAVLSNLPK